MPRRQPGWCLLMLVALLAPTPGVQLQAQDSPQVQIGLVRTLFRDVSPALIEVAAAPFSTLMKNQTGIAGTARLAADALELAEQLQEGKVHLGVFNGFEFAWAQQRFSDLKPLVIIVNRHRHLSASIVVNQENPARSVADLKGANLAIPLGTREHCHLFWQRLCVQSGIQPEEHFAIVSRPASKHRALDDIVRGKLHAVVIDGATLEAYRELKPGCFDRLKVLQQSDVFPAAVIAYKPGVLRDDVLQRLRNGLLQAAQSEQSQGMMLLWNVTAFELPPSDYQQTLTNILKNYPSPESRTRQVNQNNQPKTP